MSHFKVILLGRKDAGGRKSEPPSNHPPAQAFACPKSTGVCTSRAPGFYSHQWECKNWPSAVPGPHLLGISHHHQLRRQRQVSINHNFKEGELSRGGSEPGPSVYKCTTAQRLNHEARLASGWQGDWIERYVRLRYGIDVSMCQHGQKHSGVSAWRGIPETVIGVYLSDSCAEDQMWPTLTKSGQNR